jgi:hypothetical protein
MIDRGRGGQERSSGGLWSELLDECKVGRFCLGYGQREGWGPGAYRGESRHDCKMSSGDALRIEVSVRRPRTDKCKRPKAPPACEARGNEQVNPAEPTGHLFCMCVLSICCPSSLTIYTLHATMQVAACPTRPHCLDAGLSLASRNRSCSCAVASSLRRLCTMYTYTPPTHPPRGEGGATACVCPYGDL